MATRLAFIAAGFAMACWAPLVPYAKANTAVDDAGFGLLLLCLGAGSLCAMPLAGGLARRLGSKRVILAGGLGMVLLLPCLAIASSVALLGLALLLFGASLGSLDVAMNLHAVEVERDSATPLMSGFHAMYSIGGFLGAGGFTLLLGIGVTPLRAALLGSSVTLFSLLLAWPRFLVTKGGERMQLAVPRGVVLVLAVLAAIAFLAEGAILDWGALLLLDKKLLDTTQAGSGFMIFSAAMTFGRLTGDWTVSKLGGTRVLVMGGVLSVVGFLLLVGATNAWIAWVGFLLAGLGAANIVPVLFSWAGRQGAMPVELAIAAVTTVGYAGILAGPALLGMVADHFGLPASFLLIALLLASIPSVGIFLGRRSDSQ